MDVNFTVSEFELLNDILQERHAAILREIIHTDHHEFKEMLKERELRLESIMEKLGINVFA